MHRWNRRSRLPKDGASWRRLRSGRCRAGGRLDLRAPPPQPHGDGIARRTDGRGCRGRPADRQPRRADLPAPNGGRLPLPRRSGGERRRHRGLHQLRYHGPRWCPHVQHLPGHRHRVRHHHGIPGGLRQARRPHGIHPAQAEGPGRDQHGTRCRNRRGGCRLRRGPRGRCGPGGADERPGHERCPRMAHDGLHRWSRHAGCHHRSEQLLRMGALRRGIHAGHAHHDDRGRLDRMLRCRPHQDHVRRHESRHHERHSGRVRNQGHRWWRGRPIRG
mmetsp:Transcript_18195/g.41910  ORF Transcript_18195/g.41910 Transcript_18195/m.41910 type:complete len:274 (-) Transcript_18195:733-1554(-)